MQVPQNARFHGNDILGDRLKGCDSEDVIRHDELRFEYVAGEPGFTTKHSWRKCAASKIFRAIGRI